MPASTSRSSVSGAWEAGPIVHTIFVRRIGPLFLMQPRLRLIRDLEARLASLPPAAREKVVKSLTAIRRAKEDLESALGKDPSNALLQELLVNTYQDEMRVLTDLHQASEADTGI